jgi:ATP-binding cassette, subfamily C (CFTR/MRP), member 1
VKDHHRYDSNISAQISAFTLLSLQLASLFLRFLEHANWKPITAELLSLVAVTAVCVLSFLEHGRNVGPSTLLTSYFVIAILSDAIQACLLYVAWNLCNTWSLASAIAIIRFVLLVLECQTKRSILREPYDKLSPEETAGFLGTAFFWWVNKVLKTGYSKVLSLDDMPPLAKSLDVMKTREAMQREWDKRSLLINPITLTPMHTDKA